MQTWRVVIDGKGKDGHTEHMVVAKDFEALPAVLRAQLKLKRGETVKLAQLVKEG